MEYMFDFSKSGERRFYSWAENKKKEIESLTLSSKEKNSLFHLIEENVKIYEKERISQANIVLELVKQHNYSPKDAYAFIKKTKMKKLGLLEKGINNGGEDIISRN